MMRFCRDKKLTQQRQNSFRKTQNFYQGVSENILKNHKESAMNEVHIATAKVVLLSLISGAAVALITHLFFKI